MHSYVVVVRTGAFLQSQEARGHSRTGCVSRSEEEGQAHLGMGTLFCQRTSVLKTTKNGNAGASNTNCVCQLLAMRVGGILSVFGGKNTEWKTPCVSRGETSSQILTHLEKRQASRGQEFHSIHQSYCLPTPTPSQLCRSRLVKEMTLDTRVISNQKSHDF